MPYFNNPARSGRKPFFKIIFVLIFFVLLIRACVGGSSSESTNTALPTPNTSSSATEQIRQSCSDFSTREDAQRAFDSDPQKYGYFDADGDKIVCEVITPQGELQTYPTYDVSTPQGICDADAGLSNGEVNDLVAQKFNLPERKERTSEQKDQIMLYKNNLFAQACPVRMNLSLEELDQLRRSVRPLQ